MLLATYAGEGENKARTPRPVHFTPYTRVVSMVWNWKIYSHPRRIPINIIDPLPTTTVARVVYAKGVSVMAAGYTALNDVKYGFGVLLIVEMKDCGVSPIIDDDDEEDDDE